MERRKVFDCWSDSNDPCPRCGKLHSLHRHEDGKTRCEDAKVISDRYPYNQCRVILELDHKKDLQKLKERLKEISTPVYQDFKYSKRVLRNYVIKKKDWEEIIKEFKKLGGSDGK